MKRTIRVLCTAVAVLATSLMLLSARPNPAAAAPSPRDPVGPAARPAGRAAPAAPSATPSKRRIDLPVTSGQLVSLQTSPQPIAPQFDPAVSDYVVRCPLATGNQLVFQFWGLSGPVTLGSLNGPLAVTMDAGDAVVIQQDTRQYWVRCLPPDFPVQHVHRPGNPEPGYYLTDVFVGKNGARPYTMILNNYGTPVWYQQWPAALQTTKLSDNTVSWYSWGEAGSPLVTMDLATRQISKEYSTTTMDGHEVIPNKAGNRYWLINPYREYDLSAFGDKAAGLTGVWDCGIEEVDAAGNMLWRWTMSKEGGVPAEEAIDADPYISYGAGPGLDAYHCNSIEEDPATGNLMLSARHMNAIYMIDRATGKTIWKMGGSAPMNGARHIIPSSRFSGQHDARFTATGNITLYDNHTGTTLPARGLEFSVDHNANTATVVWEYAKPDGETSRATGNFRRYNNGNDNLVNWGYTQYSGFDEVDAAGTLKMSLRYPNEDINYRTQKLPLSAYDIDLLRRSSGDGVGGPTAAPSRLMDSRPLGSTTDDQFENTGILPAGVTVELPVRGRGGVAATATSVMLNVTSTGSTGNGFVTAWPCGTPQPTASNLNFLAGENISNGVNTGIGANGRVCLRANAETHLVVDAISQYPSGAEFVGTRPTRLLDTRPGETTDDGQHQGQGLLAAGSVTVLQVVDRGAPAGAKAVSLNVTAVGAEQGGFVTAYPCDATRPLASSLNFEEVHPTANNVVVPLSPSGQVCFYSHVATHLVVDLDGHHRSTSNLTAFSPRRLLDTRADGQTVDGRQAGPGRLADGAVLALPVAGRGGIADPTGPVTLNVTVTGSDAAGFLTAWPCDRPRPASSNVNYERGRTIANGLTVQPSVDGKVCFYAHTATDLVVDASAFYPAA